jgi:phosphoribosylformylglycinamidine cyclo-ligase
VTVADADADRAVRRLRRHHPRAARIGAVTAESGVVRVPPLGLCGDRDGIRAHRL